MNDVNEGVHNSREQLKTATLQYLLRIGVYSAAFPLHDSDVNDSTYKRLE